MTRAAGLPHRLLQAVARARAGVVTARRPRKADARRGKLVCGTIAMALCGPDEERDAVKAQAGAALDRFLDGGGCRIPGTVLCEVAG